MSKLLTTSYHGMVAIITGASRGIGRVIALELARRAVNVVIVGKSVQSSPQLPRTIFSVAQECRNIAKQAGHKASALAVQCDVRSHQRLESVVEQTLQAFGRIDFLINNAGALWWKSVARTPIEKANLVDQVNFRATYDLTQMCLPYLQESPMGRIFVMSPPIDLRPTTLAHKVAYLCSKYSMTMLAHGLAEELSQMDSKVTINAIWPKCLIRSYATINYQLGNPKVWRRPEIIAHTLLFLIEDGQTNGQAIITEQYLRTYCGYQDQDFIQYRCDPKFEPPPMNSFKIGTTTKKIPRL